jgi:hypothetical protein
VATVIYHTNGIMESVTPANGVNWSLKELQTMVGGYIQICETNDGRYMVINEHGKVTRPSLPLNIMATRIYLFGEYDPIVGPAVVVDNRLELDGPQDGKEEA